MAGSQTWGLTWKAPCRCCLLDGAAFRAEPGWQPGGGRDGSQAHVAEGGPGPTATPSFPSCSGPAGSCLVALPKDDTLGTDLQPVTQPGGWGAQVSSHTGWVQTLALSPPQAGESVGGVGGGNFSHLSLHFLFCIMGSRWHLNLRTEYRDKCENAYITPLSLAQDPTKYIEGAQIQHLVLSGPHVRDTAYARCLAFYTSMYSITPVSPPSRYYY